MLTEDVSLVRWAGLTKLLLASCQNQQYVQISRSQEHNCHLNTLTAKCFKFYICVVFMTLVLTAGSRQRHLNIMLSFQTTSALELSTSTAKQQN